MPQPDPTLVSLLQNINDGWFFLCDQISKGIFVWPTHIPQFLAVTNMYNTGLSARILSSDRKQFIVGIPAYDFVHTFVRQLYILTNNWPVSFAYYPTFSIVKELFINVPGQVSQMLQPYTT